MRTFVIEKDRWRIKSEEECYVLQGVRMVKGNPKWEAKGYYRTLAQVLGACLRKKIRSTRLHSSAVVQ